MSRAKVLLGNFLFYQIWRRRATDIFDLVGQTRLSGIAKTVQNGVYATHTRVLLESEQISVQAGDFIGLYFPGVNPVPWASKVCYESEEQLRYSYQPVFSSGVPLIGETRQFTVAPLAWDPCRVYMLQCRIGECTSSADYNGSWALTVVFFQEGKV